MSPRPASSDDFHVGQRVRMKTSPRGVAQASLGFWGLVMRINAIPYVSGTVWEKMPSHWGTDSLTFRPDGWPLPPDVWPQGFVTRVSNLQPYEGPELRAPLTTERGQPVTPEQIQRLVDEYIARQKASKHAAPIRKSNQAQEE